MGKPTLKCLARFCQRPKPGDWSNGHFASYILCSYITSHPEKGGGEVGKDKELIARMQRRGQGLRRAQRRAGASTDWADSQRKTWLHGLRSSEAFLHSQQRLWGAGLGTNR